MDANPDDLLVLLAVSRSAKFTTAAQVLGLNHTTVSRRIAALEKALGGRVLSRAAGGWELTELGAQAALVAEQVETAVRALGPSGRPPDPITGVVRMTATDGFSAYIAAPAVARLRRNHPGLSVEIVTVTRRALQQRSGLDIEVVVGEPQVHEFLRGRVKTSLGILNSHLEKTAFAAGDKPTIADISMCGYLYWPDEFGVSWSDYPRIGAWLDRIRALPGWVHPYELMPGHPLKR